MTDGYAGWTSADRSPGEITQLLREVAKGEQTAVSKLIPLVYAELHRRAVSYMCGERVDHTLQPTVLVNEAYLSLIDRRDVSWQSRAHFFGLAADLMRRILVDHARAHRRAKRGGGQRKVSLEDALLFSEDKIEEILAVDECLERLAKVDPRQARTVILRFFGGLTNEEAAEALGVSLNTLKRNLSFAKAWLYAELKERHGISTGKMAGSERAV
jgi:RNA polymerase sigma-70 factor, ECF subfamily